MFCDPVVGDVVLADAASARFSRFLSPTEPSLTSAKPVYMKQKNLDIDISAGSHKLGLLHHEHGSPDGVSREMNTKRGGSVERGWTDRSDVVLMERRDWY